MPGKNLLSRWKNTSRDDKELCFAILFVYIWLLIYFPYTWFDNTACRLDAIDKVIWAVIFFLITDFTYCYYEYGLILDLRRDFNFYASMSIIAVIVIFFVMLIFFW